MTNPKTSPVAESVVEAVTEVIEQALLRHGVEAEDMEGTVDDAICAIAAMPRPIEDDTPTLSNGRPEKAATGEATDPLDILRLTLQYAEKSLPGLRIPTLVGGIEAAIRALVKINAGQDDTPTGTGEGVECITPTGLAELETAAKTLLDACLRADAKEDLSFDIDGSMLDALSDALDWRNPVIWTEDQVKALNASQDGYGHPFTCAGDRTDELHMAEAEENDCQPGRLFATKRGWVCAACDYRQTWAHDYQFQGARPNPLAALSKAKDTPHG